MQLHPERYFQLWSIPAPTSIRLNHYRLTNSDSLETPWKQNRKIYLLITPCEMQANTDEEINILYNNELH